LAAQVFSIFKRRYSLDDNVRLRGVCDVDAVQIVAMLAMTSQAATSQAANAVSPIGSIHLGQWSGGAFVTEKTVA
jgi:hypothetical protein